MPLRSALSENGMPGSQLKVSKRRAPRAGGGWADFLDLAIDHDSEIPLLQQVCQQLRQAIVSRSLLPGSRLPSSRRLADRLGVSRTSVLSAYDQLLTEGYVEGRAGSGTYVTDDVPEQLISAILPRPVAEKAGSLRLSAAGKRFRSLAQGLEPFEDIPFRAGCCSVDAITIENWRRACSRQLRSLERVHLRYSDPIGVLSLRREVAQYLKAARAVRCDPEQVVILSGAQQALDLSVRSLIDPGDTVWVEDPGYMGARFALRAAGADLIPVPVDQDGLDVGAGLQRCRNARAAYVTPSHQFPTGAVMSMRRRLELLSWAKENDAWIIEDDYDSEFRYVGRPLASLQGIDQCSRVIYIGTLSKMLFPGIRLGFAVVPKELIEVFTGAKFTTDRQPPTLQQAMVADFMRFGFLTSHIRRMRTRYREARDVVVESVTRFLGDLIDVEVPECGMQLAVHFKHGISDLKVAEAALSHGISVRPISPLYLDSPARQGLLLGYSGFDSRKLQFASQRLAEVVKSIP